MNRNPVRPLAWTFLQTAMIVGLTLLPGQAQSDDSVVSVKRIYVPVEHPELWPKQGDWVPLQQSRFDTLLRAARESKKAGQQVWFGRALYRSTFDPESGELREGTASLSLISIRENPDSIPFDSFNPGLTAAAWSDGREAILGTDIHGRQQLRLIPGAGALQLKWTLAGRRTFSGFEFPLQLPASVVTTFELVLPRDWTLKVRPATVSVDEVSETGDLRTWRLESGLRNRFTLRLQKQGRDQTPARVDPARDVQWQQRSRFSIRQSGVEGRIEFELGSLGPMTESITLRMPQEQEIQSIHDSSDRTLSWSSVPGSTPGMNRVVVSSDGLSPSGGRVVVTTRQPTGEGRTTIRLPRVDQGLFLDGQVSVSVDRPLIIAKYRPTGLRQAESIPVDERHTVSFQQFSPESEIELDLRKPLAGRIHVDEQIAVLLDASPPRLMIDLGLTAQTRQVFEFVGLIPREWEVMSVRQSSRAGAGEAPSTRELEWSVRPQTESHSMLTVQFPTGLPVREQATIQIVAGLTGDLNSRQRPVPVVIPQPSTSISVQLFAVVHAATDVPQVESSILRRAAPFSLADLRDRPRVLNTVEAESTIHRFTAALTDSTALLPVNWTRPEAEPPNDDSSQGQDDQKDEDNNAGANPSTSDSNAEQPREAEPNDRLMVALLRFESRIHPSGSGRDEFALTWRFLNRIQEQVFQFQMPPDSELLRVEWNGQPVAATDSSVPIPSGPSGGQLTLRYTMPSQDLYLRGTYRCPIPRADNVVTAGFEWTVQVPGEFTVVSFPAGLVPSVTENVAWQQGWFGPLARPGGSLQFDPLSVDSWQQLIARDSSRNDLGARTVSASAAALPSSFSLHVCRVTQLHGLAWLVLILTLLIGIALRSFTVPCRSLIGLLWLTACLAAMNLVPATYSVVIGAALVGTILSLLVPRRVIRPDPRVESHSRDTGSVALPSTFSFKQVPVPLLLISLATTAASHAQPVSERPAARESIEILVPYRGRFVPDMPDAGLTGIIHIRRDDLNRLIALEKKAESSDSGLITASAYRIHVDANGSASLSSQFRVAVPPGNRRSIRLPVNASLLAGRATCEVNGHPASALPEPDGQTIRVNIPDRVTLAEQAATGDADSSQPDPENESWVPVDVVLTVSRQAVQEGGASSLIIPIPPVARSHVGITFDSPPPHFRLNDLPSVTLAGNSEHQRVPGPVDSLRLVWASEQQSEQDLIPKLKLRSSIVVSPSRLERETLILLSDETQPDAPVGVLFPANAQLETARMEADVPAEFQIHDLEDGRLVICEFLHEPARRESSESDESHAVQVRLKWRQPPPEESSLLQWERVVPASNPAAVIDGTDDPNRNHTAGLSASFGFRFTESFAIDTTDEAVNEWMADWPEDDRPRLPQFLLPATSDPDLDLSVSSVEATRTLQINQVVQVSPGHVDLEYSAEVQTSEAPAFTHAIQVNGQGRITAVSVDEDGVDRLSHWVQDENVATLHLNGQTTGRIQHVVVRIRMDIDPERPVRLPGVVFQGSQTEESILHVYGAPELMVALHEEDGERIEQPAETAIDSETASGQSRLAGRYRVDPGTAARLEIQPARRSPQATTLAALAATSEHPCLVRIRTRIEALVDHELAWTFPDWPLAPDAEPVISSTGIDSQSFDIERRQFRLVFREPVPETLELNVQLPLQVDPDQILTLKAASLTGIGDHLQVLTGNPLSEPSPELAQADFDRILTTFPELSTEKRIADWSDETRIRAPLRAAEPGIALPTVVLHALLPARRMAASGLTRILFSADGQQEYLVRWPERTQLVSARINGQLVSSTAGDSGALSIPISDPDAPQHLELIWKRQSQDRSLNVRRLEFELPVPQSRTPIPGLVLTAPVSGISVLPQDGSLTDSNVNRFIKDISMWRSIDHEAAHVLNENDFLLPRVIQELEQTVLAFEQSDDYQARLSTLLATSDDPVDSETTHQHGVSALLKQSDGTFQLSAIESTRPLTLWVVDARLNQLLGSLLLTVLVIPVMIVLVRIRAGDRLAEYPALSWLLLGIVWWTCLRFSPGGFLLMLISVLVLAMQTARYVSRRVAHRRIEASAG